MEIRSQRGSVAVVVAFSMIALLMMFAFVLNTGYLYGEKNKYQNGVEAAAMAGAVSLCDLDPVAVAWEIARENGLPMEAVEAQVGFYDEKDLYGNFSVYKDFVAEDEAEYPEEEYNNAVMVRVNKDVDTLMGGFVGKDEVTVKAAAVAYLVRYGMLALGEEDGDVATELNWTDGYPEFQDMGIIHANNDINFVKPPTISGNTRVSASGEISNCPEGISGVEPVDGIRPIDWEALRADAEANGRVITTGDFPASSGDKHATFDSDRNYYCTINILHHQFRFGLHDGDHGGATYYFSNEGAPEGATMVLSKPRTGTDIHATNFTVASDLPICFRPTPDKPGTIHMGGENQDSAFIYCRNNIDGGGFFNSLTCNYFEGVFFRTEKNFCIRVASTFATHKLRVIADHKITIQGHNQQRSVILNGLFGPPCPPVIVKLGRLAATAR